MVISIGVIVGSLAVLAWRHRPATADAERWGEPPEPGLDADGVETEENEAGHDEPEGGAHDDADGHLDPVDHAAADPVDAIGAEPADDSQSAADATDSGGEPDPAPVA
jgi:hypothetical protein